MGRQRATRIQPTAGRLRDGEVLHQRPHFGPVVEHGHDVASHQERTAVGFIDGRQVEEVVIHTRLSPRGEEAGDEVTLLVQPAAGRILEHRGRAIAKVRRDDTVRAAEDVIRVEPDLAPGFDGLAYFRAIERQVAAHPGVVVLQRRRAQHRLFRPVRRRPAGRRAGLDADAPRRVAVVGDLLRQGHQVVPRLRHFVAGRVESRLRIPHQALAVETVPDTSRDWAICALDLAHVQPALVVLLRQPVLRNERRYVGDLALADEGRQQAGLREVGNVRGVAGVHADTDRTLEFLAADVLHIDARGLLKSHHRLVELDRVGVGKRAVNCHDRAGVIAVHGCFQRTASHHREGHVAGFGRRFFGRHLSRLGRGFLGRRCDSGLGWSGLRRAAATSHQGQGQDKQKAQNGKSSILRHSILFLPEKLQVLVKP